MKKKQDDFKVEIDNDVVDSKAKEIGNLLEGLTLPYVFCVLGCVIVEVIISAFNQGYRIDALASNWLKGLSKRVRDIPNDLSEGQEEIKNCFGVSNSAN